MAPYGNDMGYSRGTNKSRSTGYHYHASPSGTGASSHGSTGARGELSLPDASWRWNCCQCRTGMNQSYIYNVVCIDCGHRRDTCCEVYISK
ncbi:hypothetical protein F4776DRAFT_642947 [Hypoxylon sp. NC0597]|nr:hypothetical protein F4776DRAFT_642947 [Hypoxylon sp. NC0597]